SLTCLEPEDRTSDAHTPATALALGLVLRVAPCQDWIEDDPEEQQSDAEAHTLTEILRDADRDEDRGDDVHEWNDHEHDPPERLSRDLEQHDEVVNRDDRGPAWLAGLRENLPHGCDDED